MRKLSFLILLLCLCGLTPAQKKLLLVGQPSLEQAIRSQSPTLWLDSSDPGTITATAGAVSQWSDKSGNARHFTQATAANQPRVTRPDNRENRYLQSGNLAATWSAAVGVTINDATHFTTTAQYNSVYQSILLPNPARVCATMRAVSGNTNLHFIHTGAGCSGGGVSAVTVTNTLATYCVPVTGCTGAGSTGIQDRNASGFGQIEVTAQWAQSDLADNVHVPTTTYPQYRGINGRAAVRFDGADDTMASSALSGSIFTAGAKTVFAAIGPSALATGTVQDILRPTTTYWNLSLSSAASTVYFQNYDGSNDNIIGAVAVAPTIVTATQSGGYLYLWVNGTSSAPVASGNTTDLTEAIHLSSTRFFNGRLGELITFNKVLPSDVRDRIQRGLCKKWGADC